MKLQKHIKIFDDDININGKLCAFHYINTVRKHELDGVYGISGAEKHKEGFYDEITHHRVLGFYDENKSEIEDIYGKIIEVSEENIIEVKIIDIEEVINKAFNIYIN